MSAKRSCEFTEIIPSTPFVTEIIPSTPFVYDNGYHLDPVIIQRFLDDGISESIFSEWIDIVAPPGTIKRQVLEAYAFDKATGMETRKKLPTVIFDISDMLDSTIE